MNTCLDEALRLIGHGYRVLPINPVEYPADFKISATVTSSSRSV